MQFHPTKRRQLVDRVCEQCSAPFKARPSKLAIGESRHCSRPCADRSRRRPLADQFWRHVTPGHPDECWPWQGYRSPRDRGNLYAEGKQVSAHRAAYELHYGPIPAGMSVCHRCDNPPCCNPGHLFLGTNADNVADKIAKGRQPRGPIPVANRKTAIMRGEINGNAKLTAATVAQIRHFHATEGLGKRRLAARFGISPSQAQRIITGKAWHG